MTSPQTTAIPFGATPVHQGRLGHLRRKLLTPSNEEVDPQRRQFNPWQGPDDIVVPVGRTFLNGFAMAMQASSPADATASVASLEPRWRGFAMEGAAMALGIRSITEPWSRSLFHRFLTRSGERHGYMIYVGLGWALARTPQTLWPRLDQFDALLSPLILDGFGFHRIFFNYRDFLDTHTIGFPLHRWPGPHEQTHQVLMQGIGRGLWFAAGGDPHEVLHTISTFPAKDHDSLWAGIGLAAAYAGGQSDDALQSLHDRSGAHLGYLRQGASFAIEARNRAGCPTEHTQRAARILVGRTPEQISEVTWRQRPDPQLIDGGSTACYEQWRSAIADELGSDG